MDAWLIWLIVAVVLGVVEIVTLTAVLGVFGAAALATAASAAVGLPAPVQLIVFAAASAGGVIFVRPMLHKFMHGPQVAQFGVDALVGKPAQVLEQVSGQGGRVRIGGEEWTARVAYDEKLVIPAGAVVDVMEITGSTALVYPREEPWKYPSP
jgi:membrane protein implicated in regulation of membrane protease activity